MKITIKRASLIFLALSVICSVVWYLSDYFGSTYSPIIVGLVMRLVCGIIIFFQMLVCILALFYKRDGCLAVVVLVLLLGLNVVNDAVPYPDDLIIYGLRDRIMKDYGIESLRRFARDVDKLPPNLKYTEFLPNKIYRAEDVANTKLTDTYPFLKWYESADLKAPNFLSEWDGIVGVSWGGRPHWGFYVSVNGKAENPPQGLDAKVLRVSDDIYFVMESD